MPQILQMKKVPINGRRAIAGKIVGEKRVSMGQLKEQNKMAELHNQKNKIAYIKNNIQTEEALALPKKE